jgi:hypothetical protein
MFATVFQSCCNSGGNGAKMSIATTRTAPRGGQPKECSDHLNQKGDTSSSTNDTRKNQFWDQWPETMRWPLSAVKIPCRKTIQTTGCRSERWGERNFPSARKFGSSPPLSKSELNVVHTYERLFWASGPLEMRMTYSVLVCRTTWALKIIYFCKLFHIGIAIMITSECGIIIDHSRLWCGHHGILER